MNHGERKRRREGSEKISKPRSRFHDSKSIDKIWSKAHDKEICLIAHPRRYGKRGHDEEDQGLRRARTEAKEVESGSNQGPELPQEPPDVELHHKDRKKKKSCFS